MVGALGYAALAARIAASPATTADIRSAVVDLQVLGRSEFKAVLKWCAVALFPPSFVGSLQKSLNLASMMVAELHFCCDKARDARPQLACTSHR